MWEAMAAAIVTTTKPAKNSNVICIRAHSEYVCCCCWKCVRARVYESEWIRPRTHAWGNGKAKWKYTEQHTHHTLNRSQNENASILNVNRARQYNPFYTHIFLIPADFGGAAAATTSLVVLLLPLSPSLFQFTLFIPCKRVCRQRQQQRRQQQRTVMIWQQRQQKQQQSQFWVFNFGNTWNDDMYTDQTGVFVYKHIHDNFCVPHTQTHPRTYRN